jgi:hypothetical protein
LRNRGYSAGHGESDNFFARGSSGGRRMLPLLARLQSVHVKTALTCPSSSVQSASFEVRRTWFEILSTGGEDNPKRTHVLNSPASGGNGVWKKEPRRSGAVFENNELALTQLLFDAFVGKFRRSADRSGNRVLHLVAHDREISLLFYANPTRPSAALYFQDENLAIGAY